ncbi:MAG: hypothetical protein ACJAZP_001238 [Psychromonas sp.]|jgi:hypothetical protein
MNSKYRTEKENLGEIQVPLMALTRVVRSALLFLLATTIRFTNK